MMEEKNYFGVMLDCSRNGVMRVERVKDFVNIISSFGYNMLMLYTEDVYEVEGEEYFGYLRGRYTKSELKELDAYCGSKGIELIPCIQTLAHLERIFRWNEYRAVRDVNDVLLVGEERTYELIENMFASLSECFSSKLVHIGMDEAHMVGLGKYLDKHGYENRFEILKEHLNRIVKIAEKYGFQTLIWSDMYFKAGNGGEYYNDSIPIQVTEAMKKSVHKDVGLVYWDYYHQKESDYEKMIKLHKELSDKVWFAGGAWTWTGFAPSNKMTVSAITPAIDACKRCGVKNIVMTVWGDGGRECSPFAILPSLFYAKKYYEGETDELKIREEFFALTGERYERLFDLDLPNLIGGNAEGDRNPSKYMLYCDPLCGLFDSQVKEGVSEEYAALAKKYARYKRQSERYKYLYEVFERLCKTLSYKYALSSKMRAAYKSGDKEKLKAIIDDVKAVQRNLSGFHESFCKMWLIEYKASGLEVSDLRMGGLMMRLNTCVQRITDYLEGKMDRIEELEEEILTAYGDEPVYFNSWDEMVSVNKII